MRPRLVTLDSHEMARLVGIEDHAAALIQDLRTVRPATSSLSGSRHLLVQE